VTTARKPSAASTFRPRLEALEDRLLMTVFGTDNRSSVTNTTSFPWSAVTRVEVTFPDGYRSQGSGAMVGAKHALTAAHMIYDSAHGGWATSVTVAPGQNGTSQPYGTAHATNKRTWTGWTRNGDWSYDMALLTLNKPIGNSTGWFGLKSNGIAAGTGLNHAGYPGDKGGKTMYFAYDTVDYTSGGRAFYNGALDIYNGQSGGPLWVKSSGTGSRYLVGVHSAQNASYNSGVILDTAKYNSIVSAINQDGGFYASSWTATSATSAPSAAAVPRFDVTASLPRGGDGAALSWGSQVVASAAVPLPSTPKPTAAAPPDTRTQAPDQFFARAGTTPRGPATAKAQAAAVDAVFAGAGASGWLN
jgi:V8-like Glu-specific endopeptidase